MLTPMFMVILGCFSFVSKRNHLLTILLNLEFIMLNMFWMMNTWLLITNKELFMSLMFLTITACEASIGLALLVSLIRSHGNDYFKSLSIILC
uniref:NADH-ubiquinone oxidoreductase chain 4L n=1 Tax=Opisthopatus cinctipes TaxID=574546 RepID=D7QYU3_9BILA|nr:NADH dehydrogenase subunit 4L [Opisthopatus cinctipes]ADE05873.1 NADH dehydrogenase subunit 4L [Opisthopatus cinctipes]